MIPAPPSAGAGLPGFLADPSTGLTRTHGRGRGNASPVPARGNRYYPPLLARPMRIGLRGSRWLGGGICGHVGLARARRGGIGLLRHLMAFRKDGRIPGAQPEIRRSAHKGGQRRRTIVRALLSGKTLGGLTPPRNLRRSRRGRLAFPSQDTPLSEGAQFPGHRRPCQDPPLLHCSIPPIPLPAGMTIPGPAPISRARPTYPARKP